MKKRPIADRFWEKVDQTGGLDVCWPWMAHRHTTGYGTIQHGRRSRRATHILLELEGRPLGPGEIATHSCDNPPCVNPRHVRAGTKRSNALEMVARGRSILHVHPERYARGERLPQARLTEVAVVDIRRRHQMGVSQQALATEYGVDRTAIGLVVRRKNWRHVA